MSKNRMPTFHRWGTKLLEYKRGIAIALFFFAGYKILNTILERHVSVIQPCDQPCQDAESCDPLEFAFEVTPAQIKIGKPNFVWYRARLKNRSCRRLEGVSISGFFDSVDLENGFGSLQVTVIDPTGNPVKRLPLPDPDGGISWDYGTTKGVSISTEGTIHPYQPNFERIAALPRTQTIEAWGFVGLDPGDSFETFTPILRPYRIVATSIRDDEGGLGHGSRRVLVENPPLFPQPPDGYNLLDRYAFDRPGRYTIKAGFVDEIYVYPIFSRWDNLPPWVQSIFWTAHPVLWRSKMREVKLSASPVFIEASR